MKKRLFAIIIAAVMVAAMLPVNFASANDSGSTIETTLKYDVTGFMKGYGYSYNNTAKSLEDMTYEKTHGMFEFGSASGGYTTVISSSFQYSTNGRMQLGSGNWICYKINVPADGTYTMKVYPETRSNGGDCTIYISGSGASTSNSNIFGYYTCLDSSLPTNTNEECTDGMMVQASTDYATAANATIALTAGEHYVTFRKTSGSYIYVGSFELISGAGDDAILASVVSDKEDSIFKGGSADFDAKLYMNDLSEADKADYTISYASDNNAVATVNAATGEITAVDIGAANITATVVNEAGVSLTATKKVNVVTDEIKVLYDVNQAMFELEMAWRSDAENNPRLDALDYTATNEFFAFHSASENRIQADGKPDNNYIKYSGTLSANGYGRYQLRKSTWLALEVFVPRAGQYVMEMYSRPQTSDDRFDVDMNVFVSTEATTDASKLIGTYNVAETYGSSESIVTHTVGTHKFDAPGKYVITFKIQTDKSDAFSLIDTFALVSGDNNAIIGGAITSTADSINKDEEETATVSASGYLSKTAEAASFTYSSSDEDIATVDENSGVVTGVSVGTVNIIATCADAKYGGVLTKAITVTQNEDAEITQAFTPAKDAESTTVPATATVSALAAYIGGDKNGDAVLSVTSPSIGSELATVVAPDVAGYDFLYWAKGNTTKRQILSDKKSFTFKPTVETNYIIAVYVASEGDGDNKAEFYNANGQLIEVKISGKTPSLPSMAGYGEAEKWALYGTNDTYGADAEIAYSGTKIFVAKYDNIKNYQITVDGVEGTYDFGEVVECRTTVPQGKVFKAWAKTVNGKAAEIVSLDPEYDFYAWEACTVTPIFADATAVYSGKARKIILGTLSVGDNTAYMAEYIGLEGAVEKGIMLGSTKIPMATSGTQFTVTDDTQATEVYGYAILADGTVFFDK